MSELRRCPYLNVYLNVAQMYTSGTHVYKCIISIDVYYIYLGVIVDEHMTFSVCIDCSYTSGSMSLFSIIGKHNVYGNILMICFSII